jgi:hypothetical protein
MASSRVSSPQSSIRSTDPSYPPSINVDDSSETTSTPATKNTTTEIDSPHCEFNIDWNNLWHNGKRLNGAKLRPRHRRVINTKVKESWIYGHGASLEHNGARYWLCKLCHLKRSYSTALYSSAGTTHAAKHLLREHKISESGQLPPSQVLNPFTFAGSSVSSSGMHLSRQSSLGLPLATRFSEEVWKNRFVDWVILEDVTFRQASSERLRWLIANGGELASQLLPQHHSTVSSWISRAFGRRQQIIFDLIKSAKSLVHLSFDLWTADNTFNYLGIVSHFVDADGLKREVLIGLPRIIGPHSGENIAYYVKEVIDRYELGSNLGYFVLDNATNNDTCLKALAVWFPMDVGRRRLRCVGHIINLVVRAVIFGENVNKFEDEIRTAGSDGAFDIWSRKGVIGRLHNLITFIRQTDQRRQVFRKLQAEVVELAGDDIIFTVELIIDGKTRWNSVYLMIKRGE